MHRVLFISTGLATGGAEVTLQRLVGGLTGTGYRCGVISLTGDGATGRLLAQAGVPVHSVDLRAIRSWPALPRGVREVVRQFRPDLVQGWMYHGNLGAQMLHASMARSTPLVLAVRQCIYDFGREKLATRCAIRLDARLSRRAFATTYVSDAALRQHLALGYAASRAIVIANGLDLAGRPRRDHRVTTVRSDLGLRADDVVIGHVARYHAVKDHAGFLQALAPLCRVSPHVRVLLIGGGVDGHNHELRSAVADHGIADRVKLLGERSDVAELMCAMDVFCSSSRSEGFPNVVCEAMAAEVPCVVTDVGESAAIVGGTGRVVPPGDPERMRAAIAEFIQMPLAQRRSCGVSARQRVSDHYSLRSMRDAYDSLYQHALHSRP